MHLQHAKAYPAKKISAIYTIAKEAIEEENRY